MLGPVAAVIPLTIAVVLLASGLSKLRQPDDLGGWEELGVPILLRRDSVLRAHPWGELLLGFALLCLGGVVGSVAAGVATLLMTGYLLLIARSLRAGSRASCSCFGARRAVTRAMVVRNVWYLVLAAGAMVSGGANPLWGGPVASILNSDFRWFAGLAIVAFTVGVTMWPADEASPRAGTPMHDLGDYVRIRTPAVPLHLADGTSVNLRSLSLTEPLLLLAVNPGCSACAPVLAGVEEWRERLPEVSIRLLLSTTPDGHTVTEDPGSMTLHDPDQLVRASIAEWPTPTAVLLGADGMLAGGPVSGYLEISSFIDDIHANLRGADGIN